MGTLSWIFLIIASNAVVIPTIDAKKVSLDIKGIVAAVFTPVDQYGRLNLNVIPSYAQFLSDNRVNGILVAGTTGEGPALTVNEKKRLISAWIKVARPLNLSVMFQVAGIPLPDVKELARYAERVGVDAILALPELYYKPKTTEALVYYMQQVAKAAPNTSILYYHIPEYTDLNVNIPDLVQLATKRIPTFKGIKSEDFEAGLAVLDQLVDDQRVFLASAVYLAPAALIGFTDFIMSEINIFPKLVIDIVNNCERGNVKKAKSQYNRFIDLIDIINAQGGRAAQKASMPFVTGIDVGCILPPEIRLSDDQDNTLEENLRKAGIKIVDSSPIGYVNDD